MGEDWGLGRAGGKGVRQEEEDLLFTYSFVL